MSTIEAGAIEAGMIEPGVLDKGQFHFLASRAPNRVFISVFAGVLGGAAYAALVPLILLSIAPVDPLLAQFVDDTPYLLWHWEIEHPRFAAAFAALCVFALLARAVSQIVLSNVAGSAAGQLRLYFAQRIRQLPIQDLESLGAARLRSALSIDISRLVEGAANLPVLLINISTIVCALGFIAFLNMKVFGLVLAVIAFGVVSYRLPLMLGQRYFVRARESRDGIQDSIDTQLYGAKELKLNAAKYEDFMDRGMRRDEADVVRYLNRGNIVFFLALQYGNLIGFMAIGAVTYAAARLYGLSTDVLIGVVMAMLYIVGPISVIVNAFPLMIQGTVALQKLNALLRSMPVEALRDGGAPLECREVRLEQVVYTYPRRDTFVVGPVSLSLRRGQVTFVVGGNGSGKSTLAKLISCHYLPSEGQVLYDGVALDENNLFRARARISAIFLDFHLFTHLFGHGQADLEQADAYLHKLGLAHKVRLEGSRFSTTDLSDGQRKRLALLVAFMENRNLYVFDEWAADQDPEFKRVFYT
ncbi:MAG: cyclic peptide export ABC transporter, partial [Luteimonas sp.]